MAETAIPPPSAETYSAIGPMTILPGADDLEIVLRRTFAAPREQVYAAFTDPELLARWWGPEDYSVSVVETDPHPGGRYHLVLRAPDGTEYPASGIFVQADEPDRVVMTDQAYELPQDWQDLHNEYRGEEDTPLRLIVRVLFEQAGEGTEVTVISRFPRVDESGDVLRMQATQTWEQSLDKLERVLSRQAEPAKAR